MLLNHRISSILRKEFNIPHNSTALETVLHTVTHIKYNTVYSVKDTVARLNKLLRIKIESIIPIDTIDDNTFRQWLCQFIRLQIGDTLVDERTLELNIIEAHTNTTLLPINDGSNITILNIEEHQDTSTPDEGSGKLGIARTLYADNKDIWKSSDFISYFVKNLSMSVLGARTYLYKVRKEFNMTHS